MKLKTLKDFSECMLREHKCCVPYFKEELKQEAIKWVKEYFLKDGLRASHLFMEFHDITAEDLND